MGEGTGVGEGVGVVEGVADGVGVGVGVALVPPPPDKPPAVCALDVLFVASFGRLLPQPSIATP
jgi:hypothetical protein